MSFMINEFKEANERFEKALTECKRLKELVNTKHISEIDYDLFKENEEVATELVKSAQMIKIIMATCYFETFKNVDGELAKLSKEFINATPDPFDNPFNLLNYIVKEYLKAREAKQKETVH